jgi:hypothetical protein
MCCSASLSLPSMWRPCISERRLSPRWPNDSASAISARAKAHRQLVLLDFRKASRRGIGL